MSQLDRLRNLNLPQYNNHWGEHDPIEGGSFSFSGECKRVDKVLDNYYNPLLDTEIREIMHEIAIERAAGVLKPFKEGEAVGVLPRLVRAPKRKESWYTQQRNERKERERDAMLRHRRRNNRTMRSMLED